MTNEVEVRATLAISNLSMRFGGILAIDSLDFTANTGEITAIIGPNGAGKTTAFNCVTGFYKPTAGEISVHDENGVLRVDLLPGHQVVSRARIARTFQNIRLFRGMTALENLLVAQHHDLSRRGLLQLRGLLCLKSYQQAEAAAVDNSMSWLRRMGLASKANELAGTLSYGQQRRLEIARAMCLRPQFLCLDEPAAGLNTRESGQLADDLQQLKVQNRLGLLLIEHDMSVVMKVSDRVVVLEHGKKLAEGSPSFVRKQPEVIAAYLGADDQSVGVMPKDDSELKPSSVLSAQGLSAGYGAVQVLHDINLEIKTGEIVALLGANGAGKTTFLRTVFGQTTKLGGTLVFSGSPLEHLQPHEVAALGIAHAPEGRRIMPKMTVLENLQIGAFLSAPKHFRGDLEKVFELFPRLAERRFQRAGTMSGGEQQMLAIGRALMQRPKLLLLDEPSLGLAPLIIKQIFEAIIRINRSENLSVVLVEQNARMALAIADRGYVLQNGRLVHAGRASDLAANPEIRTAYLEEAHT